MIQSMQDVNQKTLLDCSVDSIPWHGGSLPMTSKLYLNIGDQLIEYKEVKMTSGSPSRELVNVGVNAMSSLIEKLRPPKTPYDVRSTSWYEKYFTTNVQQIQNCIDKTNPLGSIKWREKPFASFVTWFSGAPEAEVLEIVLLGIAPPSNDNAATIKEFRALEEDCLEAQTEGKISADAQLIFTRVPERLLAKQIESDRKQGRCVIIASCHEEQRDAVHKTFLKLLATTSEKETLQFTPLKRDAPRPMPAESRRWRMMVLYALLPTIGLSVSLLIFKSRPKAVN